LESEPEHLSAWQRLASLTLTQKGEWRKPKGITRALGPAYEAAAAKEALRDCLEQMSGVPGAREALLELAALPAAELFEGDAAAIVALSRVLRAAAIQLQAEFAGDGRVDHTYIAGAARAALAEAGLPTDLALRTGLSLRHILVDEFQDTSLAQFDLVEALTVGWEEGDGRTLFVVGDPMQSIYQFREAEVGLFLRARDTGIGTVRLEPLQLARNFRSVPSLIAWTNTSFGRLFPPADDLRASAVAFTPSLAGVSQPRKQGDDAASACSDADASVSTQTRADGGPEPRLAAGISRAAAFRVGTGAEEAARPDVAAAHAEQAPEAGAAAGPEHARAAEITAGGALTPDFRPPGEESAVELRLFPGDDHATETAAVTERIAKLRASDPAATVAILVAARTHATPIMMALEARGVDAIGVDLIPLQDLSIIRDLVALLQALHHLGDRTAWLAVLRAPWCGLSLKSLTTLSQRGDKLVVWEAISDPQRLKHIAADELKRLARVREVLDAALQTRDSVPLADWLEAAWLRLGAADAYPKQDLRHARAFLNALSDRAASGEWGGPSDVGSLLAELFAQPQAATPNPVQIMTIHRAKGLEFDHVFVPSLDRELNRGREPLLRWLDLPRRQGESDLIMAPVPAIGDDAGGSVGVYLKRLIAKRMANEQLRLLYVAATRSKKTLYLSAAPKTKADRTVVPRSGTLLASLWPALRADFEASVMHAAATEGADAGHAIEPTAGPPPSPSAVTSSAAASGADASSGAVETLSTAALEGAATTPEAAAARSAAAGEGPAGKRGPAAGAGGASIASTAAALGAAGMARASAGPGFAATSSAAVTPGPMWSREGPPNPTVAANFLRRLPANWSPPPIGTTSCDLARLPLGRQSLEPPEFSWVGETSRHIGTVVHAALESFAEAAELPTETRIRNDRDAYRHQLLRHGVPEKDLSRATDLVLEALTRTVRDERGRWIFGREHQEARSELALTGIAAGRLTRVVIDRSFVDQTGTRWVIDFKTSRHEGGGLETFLQHEIERYRPQLETYVALARGLGPQPVKAGLYFPLLGVFRELPAGPNASAR
jgi:ATP-dependent exoDNAse (exonuclease V) beta subunit